MARNPQQKRANTDTKGGARGPKPQGNPRRQGAKPARKPGQHKARAQKAPSNPKQKQEQPKASGLAIPENSQLIPGRQPVLEALKAKRPIQAIFYERNLNISPIPELAKAAGITLAFAGRDEMDAATNGVLHQGVLGVAKPTQEPQLNDHLNHNLVVIADGITDARNLGAIARSAEQAGAGCLIIRSRRAASTSPAAEKAAAGALSWLPVITVSNITNAVKTLQQHGMWAVALDDGEDAQNLFDLNLMDERVALIVGEEGAGIGRVVRDSADAIASIPMNGHLDSLNASVATGIALFEWVRRHP